MGLVAVGRHAAVSTRIENGRMAVRCMVAIGSDRIGLMLLLVGFELQDCDDRRAWFWDCGYGSAVAWLQACCSPIKMLEEALWCSSASSIHFEQKSCFRAWLQKGGTRFPLSAISVQQ